jgi:aquaporin-4
MSGSVDDLRSPFFWRSLVAEAIGTFVLVLIGCGTCLGGAEWETNEPTKVQISLSFGLGVATMVWCLAHISGGHINPAVTVAMLAARRISIVRAILYVFVQCAGALAGAAALMALTPATLHGGFGLTTVSPLLTKEQGFGVEFVITFILVLTVFSCCDDKRTDLNGSAPLTIGFAVTLCHLFAIKYTGSSMNPARSFGPAVIMGNWTDHWVYWVGPILGGIAAGLLYEFFLASDASMKKARKFLLTSESSHSSETDIEFQEIPSTVVVTEEKERLKVTEVEASL